MACQWNEWGECMGEKGCMPGETRDLPCGETCSVRTQVCDDVCEWVDQGECVAGGTCNFPDTETQNCGLCGVQTRNCDANTCGWSEWSQCDQPANACTPGDEIQEQCGTSDVGICSYGTHRRSCLDTCQWSDWSACEGAILPQNEICGSAQDENCDGLTERREDQYEANNTCSTCYSIGGTDPNVELYGTMDSVSDNWDYFCFQVDDEVRINPFAAYESIEVSLSNIPNEHDYDLFLYRSVDECNNQNELDNSVNSSDADESISWNEQLNHDDSGVYVVGVKRYRSYSCIDSYRLTINGLD
jgi:hypothetical protein